MKNIKSYLSFSAFVLVFIMTMLISSCKKFTDIGAPPNALTADKVFTDSAATMAVALNMYSNYLIAGNNTFSQLVNISGAMSADEAYNLLGSIPFDQYKNNALDDSNASVSGGLYTPLFSILYSVNTVLEGVESSSAISPRLKNQLLGEARFLRAYYYFYLVNYFGDLPLVTNTNSLVIARLPKSPASQIYAQMVTDLLEAKTLLTDTYPSAERIRINRKAASALLARVYLYMGNYAAAESEATQVISSNIYSLQTALNTVFLKTSNETIWQVQSNSGAYSGVTRTGIALIPAGTTPTYVLYSSLVSAFETGDNRRVSWTNPISYGGRTYYYPYKYKNRNTAANGNEYSIALRLAEQYLIRSEARLQQGNAAGSLTDINMIRNRAGLASLTSTDRSTLTLALEQERRVELFTENSDRWFNLRRTGRLAAVLPLTKVADIPGYAWRPYQSLYAIPAIQLAANPNLVQNQGY